MYGTIDMTIICLYIVGFYPNQTITVDEGDVSVNITIEMRTDKLCGQAEVAMGFTVNSSDARGKSFKLIDLLLLHTTTVTFLSSLCSIVCIHCPRPLLT